MGSALELLRALAHDFACFCYCDFFSMRIARGESVITASIPRAEAAAYASAESTPNATIFTSPLVLKHLTAAGGHHRVARRTRLLSLTG
jgi:hypothetical protein